MVAERVTGSFRDPSGYVFKKGSRIFRAVDESCHSVLQNLSSQGHLQRWIDRQLIVPSTFVEDGPLKAELQTENPGFAHFIEHQVVPEIAFPYEWSVSMLADAGALTLQLQKELIQHGCSLKDASAFNIQFVNGRPIFIDLSSVEQAERLDVWFALGQFQRMFLFPLLLCRDRGWDVRSYFLSNLDGRSVGQVGRSFGLLQRLRPSLLLDVTLPLWLEQRANSRNGTAPTSVAKRAGQNAAPQMLNLNRLERKLNRLAKRYRPQGVWSDYTQTCSYDQTAENAKKKHIKSFLQSVRPSSVLDLGCNTGEYSELAVECGVTRIVAADADHDAIEILYRRLKGKSKPITPMVIDLANPSPGIGYMNRERAGFLERVKGDCVFALALMHHLLVSANFPLDAVRDLLFKLSNRYLILEFVPPDDPMFKRLVRYRKNLHANLTIDDCMRVFAERFNLISQSSLENSPRTLLFFEKNESA